MNKSLHLMMRMLDPKEPTEPMISLPPKPEIPAIQKSTSLPRHTPERHGISSRHIAAFLQTLEQDPTLNMHSIMILRDGCVLCEASFGAQDIRIPRMTFSACKSIVSLAVGILMDDGVLRPETQLTELFPEAGNAISRRLMKDLTVEELLSMRSGAQFNEIACMTQEDWLSGFFSPGLSGGRFQYNSLNTYILSRIVCQLSGRSLSDFLSERLFGPMGIRDFYWEVCPNGTEKGGWGLYLRAEDLGKLGQLVLDGGLWEGHQLISREYLEKATQIHAKVPMHYGDYDYGWQFWVGRKDDIVLMNGMLGQNVLCFRENGITVVSHAGNEETFQQSNYFRHAAAFFARAFDPGLPRDAVGIRGLRKTLHALVLPQAKLPTQADFARFFGRRFVTDAPKAPSTGSLPLTLQAVQNCYTKGVQAIAIGGSRETVEIFYEERDTLHHILAGTRAPHIQSMEFGGNVFRVAAYARFTHDEDETPVLRVQLDFLETPFSRILKLYLTPSGMTLRQEETPCMDKILETVLSDAYPAVKTLIGTVFGTGDLDFLRWRMSVVFAPELEFTEE
ncbi:MAG: serine hydrolase [Oscillospiraceae bacterium]|nr:serine hydrolase [Oscillospiraceae bacterium]